MTTLLGILLSLAGAYIVVMNWLCVRANLKNAREGVDRHHSLAPLVGPLFMTVGLGTLSPGLGWLLLLPWIVDPGTWILVYSLPFLVRELVGGGG